MAGSGWERSARCRCEPGCSRHRRGFLLHELVEGLLGGDEALLRVGVLGVPAVENRAMMVGVGELLVVVGELAVGLLVDHSELLV